MRNYNPMIHKNHNGFKKPVIKIEGKIKRESDKAILVETHMPDNTVKDIWFPLSQVEEIHRTFSVVNKTLDSLVISQWIAGQKGITSPDLIS